MVESTIETGLRNRVVVVNPRGTGQGVMQVTREARGRLAGDSIELAFGYWPGRGAPVVALHGLTASYVNFIGIAERLAGRLPLLGFDLRGRGDSDKPEGPYGMVQHARDVAAAMRTLGLASSIVIGHSMGAFVATALAAQDPKLVSGLVLIDGGYVPATTPAAADQNPNAALVARIAQLRQTYPSRQEYRQFWRTQPHFPPEEWNHWVEAFLDYEVGGDSPVRPKASENAVLADLGEVFQREAIVERLKSIRVPTILLRAERGFTPDQPPLFPDELAEETRTFVPHIEDHKYAGTTHYTIALGERSAARTADLICALAQRLAPAVD
jgi:lipase